MLMCASNKIELDSYPELPFNDYTLYLYVNLNLLKVEIRWIFVWTKLSWSNKTESEGPRIEKIEKVKGLRN